MKQEKQFPVRKSPRLPGYDYTHAGAYFVTICTDQRRHLFGSVSDEGIMHLNRWGAVAAAGLEAIPQFWQGIEVDCFVVMPNHVHVVIIISHLENVGTSSSVVILQSTEHSVGTPFSVSAPSNAQSSSENAQNLPDAQKRVPTLGQIIGNYKAGVTRRIREDAEDQAFRVWQSRYYDHIIRNDADLNRIREYVRNNPAKWHEDTFYSE